MSLHYRQRRISETILRYRPADLDGGKHGVRDLETGQLVPDAAYDDDALARAKCRMLAAADIESLYVPDEATALARIEAIIAEQSDPAWAARLIWEYVSGAKA